MPSHLLEGISIRFIHCSPSCLFTSPCDGRRTQEAKRRTPLSTRYRGSVVNTPQIVRWLVAWYRINGCAGSVFRHTAELSNCAFVDHIDMMKQFIVVLFCVLSALLPCGTAENGFDNTDSLSSVADGLSWTFYQKTCPSLETIVKQRINFYLKQDITQAAGLLRLHFHDCFVQGCDGSVLLDGSASGPGEQSAPPNLTLRPKAFQIINDIKEHVDKACGVVVSCADITALAARDSVAGAGGPEYRVPLGRRDSLNFATRAVTLANLPAPTSSAALLLANLSAKGLDATDLVALSGGHTIGIGHCSSFTNRLYPTQDATLNASFAKGLYSTCPSQNSTNTTVLDILTPNLFDNKYYVDLKNREGLFTSDQDLYTNTRTKPIVGSFARNQTLFFEKFVVAMTKMGRLGVLTGSRGEVRVNCSARNPSSSISTLVDGMEEGIAFAESI